MTGIEKIKTREQVRSDLLAAGITITQWAKDHGFSRELVYAVLSGRVQGRFGEGHEVAVALGLKDSRDQS